MSTFKKPFLVTCIIALLMIFFGQPSQACVCEDPFLGFESLAEIGDYDFIAYVKIIKDGNLKEPTEKDNETIGLLTVQILELFKGDSTLKIAEYLKNTSCDIGISEGEEWILFGKKVKGQMTIQPCERHTRYRAKDGLRDWKRNQGFYVLDQMRRLYHHPIHQYGIETRREFYKDGSLEVEEGYFNGKLNGDRKIWYPNGQLFCHQFYMNDTLDGKSEWFYESGQVYEEDFYKNGKHFNISRIYYDTTWEKDWLESARYQKSKDTVDLHGTRIKVEYENVYDLNGNAIISREYNIYGKIRREEVASPDRKFRTSIFYGENGFVSSIENYLNDVPYGHYQDYDENGFPSSGWDYDEQGHAIRH